MSRRRLIAANWKMNHLRADAEGYCQQLSEALAGEPATAEVAIFPPFPLLHLVWQGTASARAGGSTVEIGGQDLHPERSGAHTGDVSAPMLADAGCRWALCGHSERRHDHGEDDALVIAKARAARDADLLPLICVGETEEEREAERTEEVLERQLGAVLEAGLDRFELAYEPVWAIGTGRTATPELTQQAHAFLRRQLGDGLGEGPAAEIRLLYGGSVKPDNCESLIVEPDIDGFLIGGASLDSGSFLDIIRRCDRAD